MTLRPSLAFLALLTLAAASCGGKSSPTEPTMGSPPGTAHTVNVGGSSNIFSDSQSGSSTTTISVGQTVQWMWVGGTHSTTSGNCCTANGLWDSGVQSSGMFSRTFTTAGSFPYYCSVHGAMMTGTVVVNP